MAPPKRHLFRRLLPWSISLVALVYVFGFATDWGALAEKTRQADLPVFLAVTVADKLVFFVAWALLQAESIRRFVTPVPRRSVLALRGGSELVRAVNHGFGDAAFILGLTQFAPDRIAAVIAATSIPFLCHMLVLLFQVTLSLAFLDGGLAGNRDVAVAAGIGWFTAAATLGLVRFGPQLPAVARSSFGGWLMRLRLRPMGPILGWFVVLAAVDVVVQRVTAASFGIDVPWWALVARIPILYAALSVPSLGNFGTRELAWAGCFSDFAPRDTLIAYAFATNATFLVLNVVIGVLFLPRALELVTELRRARQAGAELPEPLISDPSDP